MKKYFSFVPVLLIICLQCYVHNSNQVFTNFSVSRRK